MFYNTTVLSCSSAASNLGLHCFFKRLGCGTIDINGLNYKIKYFFYALSDFFITRPVIQ